jgi:outer membrane protein
VKKYKKLSLIGLSILSQLSIAVAKPNQSSARKQLITTLDEDYYKKHADELVSSSDIMTVFNQAVETEPTLAQALGFIDVARYNVDAETIRRYSPTINLAAGISATNIPVSGWAGDLGVILNRSLWNVPQDKLIEKAKTDLSKAEIEEEIQVQTLIASVVDAYFNAARNQDILALRKQVVEALEKHRETIKEQVKVGLVTQADLDRVDANLGSAKAAKNSAAANLEISMRAFVDRWDLKVDKLVPLKGDIKFTQPEPADPAKWKEIMVASSLIFQRDAKSIESAQIDIEREKAAFNTPQVNFSAGCSTVGSSTPLAPGDSSTGCNVGLNIVQPIFNGGYTNSKIKSLTAQKGIAMSELDNDHRKSLFRIDTAFMQLNVTLENIEQYKKAVKSAEDALAGMQEQYLNGLTSSGDLLTVIQNTLVPAKEQLLAAKYTYFTQEIELKNAAGTLSVVDLLEINKMLKSK